MDVLQQLFAKNANEILQCILLYLDFKSLHDARTVSKKWNEIICDLLWNSKKGEKDSKVDASSKSDVVRFSRKYVHLQKALGCCCYVI